MAVLRLARLVMPSPFMRPIKDFGCFPAFLPGNSRRGSARLRAAPKGFRDRQRRDELDQRRQEQERPRPR